MPPSKTKEIFILRNNDLGDVLLTTPLVKGLKKNFPEANVFMGVGDWARPLLENNPDLDGIVTSNAPWHNKQNCRFPANSPRTFLEGMLYVLISKESQFLRRQKYTHGIDVLGSRQGSWLLLRGGIPHRFGVRGYAGGDTMCERCVDFIESCKVTESALAFIPLLGGKEKVDPRPILLLNEKEKAEADVNWGKTSKNSKRIVIAPGAGFPEKSWGNERFTKLVEILYNQTNHQIRVIGSMEDRNRINFNMNGEIYHRVLNYSGKLSLRQSAALVCRSDFVISNSSITMHLAGCFETPSITILGECYDSAKLHQEQWGHPNGIIMGKETSNNIHNLPRPNEILRNLNRMLSDE